MSSEANEDVTRGDARVVEFNDTENWGERDEKKGTGTEMRGSLEGVRDEMRGHTESCDPKNAGENQNQKVVIDYEASVDLFSVTKHVSIYPCLMDVLDSPREHHSSTAK